MNLIIGTVFASLVLGPTYGIIGGLIAAIVIAGVRSHGTLGERALGMSRTGFLQGSVAFSLVCLIVQDWQTVASVWLLAGFLVSVWSWKGPLSVRDRSSLVASFSGALAGLALAWLLINWVTTPTFAWLATVVVLAAGLFCASWRWPALPWTARGHQSGIRTVGFAANLVMSALVIALPFASGFSRSLE
jgi:hypothetical protein